MSTSLTSAVTEAPAERPSPAVELRHAGWGAIVAAIALLALPVYVFVGPLLGVEFLDGAAKFDPVTNASWTTGLFGLFEIVEAAGIAVLVVAVQRALPAGLARELGAVAGVLWVGGLALHAAASMVQNTPTQVGSWRSISDDVSVRATIGAAVTVVEWAFFGVAIFAALAWTIAFLIAGRPAGFVRLGSGIPAVVIAVIAAGLAAVGIIPPAATFAQIVLWLLIGIPLLRRARALRGTQY